MSRTIEQTVKFAGISASELFAAYLTSEHHAALVGAPAHITNVVGAPFWVFDQSGVRGRNIFIDPDHTIVQAWRGQTWRQDDPDSVVVLIFGDDGVGGTEVQLIHAGVPDHTYSTINAGWHSMYWNRWREYLDGRKSDRHRAASALSP